MRNMSLWGKLAAGGIFWLLVLAGPAVGQSLQDTLYVKSLILTTDVVENEPVDTVQAFAVSVDRRAYCHARIYNGLGEVTVTFQWLRNGQLFLNRPITITASSSYRVYTSIEPAAGKWEVRILGPDKRVIARKRFSILASTVRSAG